MHGKEMNIVKEVRIVVTGRREGMGEVFDPEVTGESS